MQPSDPAQHEFARDKSAKFCLVCQNLWPASGAVVSKYHRCTRCSLTIHTACRDLAAKVCPCDANAVAQQANTLPVRTPGQLAVKVLHAYDTTAQPGVTVYGILKVVPGRDSVHTSSAVVGAQDVVWDGKSYTLPVHPQADHAEADADDDQDALDQALWLEIWRSMYLLLDQQLASVTISLEPLFRFPNITAERWFQLKDPDGADWGTVLLQLTFMPQVSSLLASMEAQNIPRERTSLRLSAPLMPAAALQPLRQREPSPEAKAAPVVISAAAESPKLSPSTPPAPPTEPSVPSDITQPVESESMDHPQEVEPQHPSSPPPVEDQLEAVNARTPSMGSEMDEHQQTQESSSPQAVPTEQEHAVTPQTPTEEKPRRRIQRHAASELSVRHLNIPQHQQPQSQQVQQEQHPAHASGIAPTATATAASRPGRPVPDVRKSRSDSESKAPQRQGKPGFHSTTVKPSFDTTVRDTLRPHTPANRANRANSRDAATTMATTGGDTAQEFSGVGRLHIFVLSAHRTPTKDNPNGDHYVRVEIGGQELDCTHTVYQTPNPLFNRKFMADVKHFKTDIRLVLVDASNDRKLGSVDTSVFAIMQRDADSKNNWKLAPIEEQPIKDGDRLIGHMQVKLAFEEDTHGLFLSQHPHLAAPAPDESFSVERLRIHIARAQAVVQWVTDAIRQYKSVMDWDFPLWTFFLLVMFVYTTLTIDAEYALCAPLFIVVFQLTWSLGRRHFGQYRQFWVERLGQNDESTLPFRPVAHLKVAVAGYKNLTTKLPNGQQSLPFVKVTYLPYGEAPAQSLLPSELLIGCTNTAATDRLPSHSSPRGALDTLRSSALVRSVASFLGSDHARDAILHNVVDTWRRLDSDVEDQTFVYPLLHPIVEEGHLTAAPGDAFATSPTGSVSAGSATAASGGGAAAAAAGSASTPNSKGTEKQAAATSTTSAAAAPNGTSLVPWQKSNAMLKFTIYGENPATFMASPWGHVLIPVRDLVADERSGGVQPEVLRWYDVIWTGKEEGEHLPYHEEDNASLNIRAQLELRVSKQPPSELEIETSRTIQSMLDRTGGGDKQQSSLSTIWNLRDNVAYVQNVLARILDSLESFKNLLNWTHPRKTAVVYAVILATWLAFVNIPGRYLILLAGLYEFFKKWVPVPPDDPWTTRYLNLLQSIPNDDDLRQVYQHEHEEYLKNKRKRERQQQRRAKLRLVFECQWEGMVKIKVPYWTEKFLVVQGHRLVWWMSEADLESGKPPEGQLLLQGHTGLTHASPVDIREVGDDTRLLSVFGRDSKGNPEKRTFLCATAEEKAELEKAIQHAIGLKAD